MSFPILEHVAKTARHTTLFLSCGAAKATAGTVHFLVFAVVALFVFGAGSARAADCDDSAEGFNEWLNSFKQVAMSNGVSREVVDAALNGVTYDASVKAHDHGVAMFGHNFAGFAASHVTPGAVARAGRCSGLSAARSKKSKSAMACLGRC